MNFFKLHKQLTILFSILLIVFIVIIINLDILNDKSNSESVSDNCDIAIVYSYNMDKEYLNFAKQGVKNACTTLDKSYKSFNSSDYNNSLDKTLEAAVKSNASFVLLADSSYEETMYKYQGTYTGTYFLLLGGVPHNGDSSDTTINYNVMSLVYNKSEASFLVGYASVYEGFTNLNFICDESDVNSLQYCYGFLQGADFAAHKLNISDVLATVTYNSNPETASYDVLVSADLIASASDQIIKNLSDDKSLSSIPIADCDSCECKTKNVIMAASVNLSPLIEDRILNFYNNHQKDGGVITNKNAIEYDILLNFNSSSFNNFDDNAYNEILTSIKNQEVSIISDTTVPIDELELTHIQVKDNKPLTSK